MNRAIRCRACGERFYVSVGEETDACQNCAGTHDPSAQLIADAKGIEKATARPKGKPQSINPRNPGTHKDPA
ncbi:hypothetical protein [Mesorhizobium sp. M1252]|uniref:hypothetical protein n=1 Tax=Mesorhizobium sp. M1252 TaxID=2957073 RepID=UPI00333ADFBC